MATIVATPGAADANSYADEATAIAYAATRLNLSGWTTVVGASCTEVEKKALIEATRELDRLEYQGYRYTSTQALSWPRIGAINTDAPRDAPIGEFTGYPEYPTDALPLRLREAAIELAFEFLKAGTTDLAALDASLGVVRKKIDVIETEWIPSARPQGLARFPRVIDRIRPLLAGDGSMDVVRS